MTPDLYWNTAAQGFAVNMALIMVVGPQNLLVIRQALLRRPLLTTILVCFIVDAALITFGVTGVGAAIAGRPWVTEMVTWAAVAFLVMYAAKAWWTAVTFSSRGFERAGSSGIGRSSAAVSAFAVSALNPHAYLDSAVIMGGLAAPLPSAARFLFCGGAIVASAVWFFGLGYGANRLSPRLSSPGSLRALDATAAVCLLALCGALLWQQMS